uniref:Microfibril associated protein 5 n=1 Tax=Aotus nancymaae TaxID=37293 RepID=A0A2K5DID9_AOTNA
MLLLGPRMLLFLAAFIIPSDWILLGVNSQRGDDVTPVTPETFTEDPNLVNDPATDETVLADIAPSTDDLASPGDKNATATGFQCMYIANKEICSRLVCKEHEAMKDELCRQMVGLPPRRLRRSNYFLLNPCENVDLQKPNGL